MEDELVKGEEAKGAYQTQRFPQVNHTVGEVMSGRGARSRDRGTNASAISSCCCRRFDVVTLPSRCTH